MLIKLEVENFRSINERIIFHTIERNYKRFLDHVFHYDEELSLLKTSGIYGANGSGKTNLFKALHMVKRLIEDSEYLNSIDAIKNFTTFKLDTLAANPNCYFQVDFISNKKIYAYTIEVNPVSKIINFENLSLINNDNTETIILTRTSNNNKNTIEFINTNINKNIISYLENIPQYTLILSLEIVLSLLQDENLDNARTWFIDKVEFLFPVYDFLNIAYILNSKPEYLKLSNEIINSSNVGINKIEISKIPINVYFGLDKTDTIKHILSELEYSDFHSFTDTLGNYCTAIKEDNEVNVIKLICLHNDNQGNPVAFEVDQESRGTIVLLHLIPALILSYGEGVNYFLDDINTSLHPILLREILGQYLTHNLGEAKGQLIFNSHEDFIMDEKIFRQDELWLMEKNKSGASDLFPLSDIKNVRFDLNLRKNYLNGKFGGVPFESQPNKIVFK